MSRIFSFDGQRAARVRDQAYDGAFRAALHARAVALVGGVG